MSVLPPEFKAFADKEKPPIQEGLRIEGSGA